MGCATDVFLILYLLYDWMMGGGGQEHGDWLVKSGVEFLIGWRVANTILGGQIEFSMVSHVPGIHGNCNVTNALQQAPLFSIYKQFINI